MGLGLILRQALFIHRPRWPVEEQSLYEPISAPTIITTTILPYLNTEYRRLLLYSNNVALGEKST